MIPGASRCFSRSLIFGKYYKTETKSRILPLSIYVNHAAADGYHTAKLLNDIQYNCTHCKEWMQ